MINSTINYLFSEQIALLFIGFYLSLGIYNFLVWFKIRERQNYLYFLMFALSITLEAIVNKLSIYYDLHFFHNSVISLFPASFMILLGGVYGFKTYTKISKVLGVALITVNLLCSLLALYLQQEGAIYLAYLLIFSYVLFFFIYTLVKVVRSPDKKYDILISIVVSGILCGAGALYLVFGLTPPPIISNISYLVIFLAFANNLSKEYHAHHCELEMLKDSLQEQVDQKTSELNRSNSELRNVINIIAHDFKDNLSVVSSCFNRYVKKPSPDYEEIIRKELTRITQDMNAYLDTKKEKSDNKSDDTTTCYNLSDFLKERIKLYKIELEEKGYNLKISSNIEQNIYLPTNRTTLNKIVSNLISNAIKYTLLKDSSQTNYITISLTGGPEHCLLSIRDSGIGIRPENRKAIFEPFFRESERVQGCRGKGLGLSIVKGAVESLDGSITIESAEGKGSTFTVLLNRYRGGKPVNNNITKEDFPVEIEHNTIDEFRQEPVEGRYNILYVENELKHIKIFCDEYSESFNIQLALNGREALELLKSIPRPHLIISDIHMPTMDGLAFREKVIESYRDIPFVFLTALESEKLVTKSYHVGALAIWQKTGLDYDKLKLQIMALCNHSDIGREQIVQAAEVYSREKIELIAKKFGFNETRTHIFGYMLEGYKIKVTETLLLEKHNISSSYYTIKGNRAEILATIRKGGYQKVKDIGSLRDFFNSYNPDES